MDVHIYIKRLQKIKDNSSFPLTRKLMSLRKRLLGMFCFECLAVLLVRGNTKPGQRSRPRFPRLEIAAAEFVMKARY